jgi:hypothetical protein
MPNLLILEDLEESVAPPSGSPGSLPTADWGAVIFVAAIIFVS